MAYFPPEGSVVLFGGLIGSPGTNAERVTDDTWAWDGKSWRQLHPTNSPPARFAGGLVYDPGSNVLVLYGGDGVSQVFNDTWTWDGTNWRQMSPRQTPPSWVFPAMTYDAARKAALLYVGLGLCPCITPDQTWSWDGSSWTQIPTGTVPDPNPGGQGNLLGTIAYDAATAQTLLIGANGTWSLGKGGWERVAGGGPATQDDRTGFVQLAASYDEARQMLYAFGPNGDTWGWNGIQWIAQNPPSAPPARGGEALAYDAARQQVVMFGGATLGPGDWSPLGDTWSWDGQTWKMLG